MDSKKALLAMPFAEARGMPPQEVVRSLIEAKVEKIPLLQQLVLELRLTIRPVMMPNDKQIPICQTHIKCKLSIAYVFIHTSYILYCTFRVDRYVFYMYISAALILLSPNREWFSVQNKN